MSDVGRELDTVVVSTGDDAGGRKVDQSGAVRVRVGGGQGGGQGFDDDELIGINLL